MECLQVAGRSGVEDLQARVLGRVVRVVRGGRGGEGRGGEGGGGEGGGETDR